MLDPVALLDLSFLCQKAIGLTKEKNPATRECTFCIVLRGLEATETIHDAMDNNERRKRKAKAEIRHRFTYFRHFSKQIDEINGEISGKTNRRREKASERERKVTVFHCTVLISLGVALSGLQ